MNCPVCGSPVSPGDNVCRTCGAALTASGQTAQVALPKGATLLGGQYVIERVLGQGGFGITYEGQDSRLGLRAAIKELFLDGSTRRGGTVYPPGSVSTAEYSDTKKRFLDEAKTLASFNDPSIVRVYNYFEENGTAYLVMEFLEGATLGSAIEKRGPVPPDVVLEIARNMAHTLELVHSRGLLHRDIKPDNIFLHKSGRIVLIDFGSVRSFAAGQATSHTRLITPGYAPLEQYSSSARFGPYTDLYALGATLLHALTGTMPPPATDLINGTPLPAMPASTPPSLRRAIEKCMAMRVEDRPQSAHELLALLTAPAQAPQRPPPPPVAAPTRMAPPPASAPAPSAPQARPQPAPQAPPPPRAAPGPVPSVPTPAPPVQGPLPQRPANVPNVPPIPTRKAAPLGRNLLIAVGLGLGAVLGGAQAARFFAAPVAPGQYALAGVAGALAGAALGWALWLAMPVVLPIAAAAGAWFYATGAGLHWPTVYSLSVMAAVFSIIFLRLIRRISW